MLGLVDVYALFLTFLALPFVLVGARLGDFICCRVNQETFNKILGSVLLVSGITLILK